MDYTTLKDVAYGIGDRSDAKTLGQYDNFLRIVEARINRKIKTSEMCQRAILRLSSAKNYYGLPPDFAGLRSISTTGETSNLIFEYLSPHQVDSLYNKPDVLFYTIEANQLRIYKPQDIDIEIAYYQKLLPLVANTSPTNWLSESDPNVYIFGLLVEINSMTKDKDAAAMWDVRFNEALDAIIGDDAISRWSGTPIVMRLG